MKTKEKEEADEGKAQRSKERKGGGDEDIRMKGSVGCFWKDDMRSPVPFGSEAMR